MNNPLIGAVLVLAVFAGATRVEADDLVGGSRHPTRTARSAEELKNMTRALLKPEPVSVRNTPPPNLDTTGAYDWVAEYLSSSSPEIRDAAIEIVATARWGFSSRAMKKYSAPEYPLPVRLAATVHSPEVNWDELMAMPVSPPFIQYILASHSQEVAGGRGIVKQLDAITIARVLAGLSRMQSPEMAPLEDPRPYDAVNGLSKSRPEVLVGEIVRWYSAEPDANARFYVLIPSQGITADGKKMGPSREDYLPVWSLAAQDWFFRNCEKSFFNPVGKPPFGRSRGTSKYRSGRELQSGLRSLTAPAAMQAGGQRALAEDLAELRAALSSEDPDLHDAAASILARIAEGPASEFDVDAHLASKFLSVRMAALSKVVADASNAEKRRASKREWAKLLNEALAQPVCPPFLAHVLAAAPWPISDPDWIANANRENTVRRLLRSLHQMPDADAKTVLGGMNALPPALLWKEVASWYVIEPDWKVRRLPLQHLAYPRADADKYAAVRDAGMKDWAAENVKLARALPSPCRGRGIAKPKFPIRHIIGDAFSMVIWLLLLPIGVCVAIATIAVIKHHLYAQAAMVVTWIIIVSITGAGIVRLARGAYQFDGASGFLLALGLCGAIAMTCVTWKCVGHRSDRR